jgi:hypothetical protein
MVGTKARRGFLGLVAGALFLGSGLAAGPAAAASGPSQAAQNAFVKKIDTSEITGIPDKVIATLGVSICQLLANGESVTTVNNSLTVPSKATNGNSFPQQFVTLMLVQASKLLCPKEAAKVQHFVSTGKKAKPLATDQALSSLLPPESDKCTASTTVTSPPGLVGLVDYEQCSLPNLGSNSDVYGYIFDNASDYASSLAAYNKFKDITPATAGVGCPTPNTSDNGVVEWSNGEFPTRSDQVVECTYEAASATAKTNNVPNYVWTVPSKFVIISAEGDPGSTMKHLDQWWTKYSLT